MSVIIQHKRGTATQWTTLNPTLAAGEVGWESDTNKFKIGTGSTAWNSLLYATLTPSELSSTYAKLVGGNAFTDAQTITSTAIGQVPLSIIPFTDQTASTFRVRNSTNSADLMSIDSSGQIRTTTILNPNSFNNSRLLMQDTGILMDTGVTTNIPLAVRGSNGQTADLQRWQSWNGSTATTLTSISSNGSLTAPSLTVSGSGTYTTGSIYADSNWGMIFRARTASPVNAQYRWANSADGELMRLDNSGRLIVSTAFSGATQGTAQIEARTVNATTIGTIVRGFGTGGVSTQSADLQQWQTFDGTTATTRARVDSGGNLKATNVATLNSIAQMAESNSGALFVMGRATAQASSPGLNTGTLYFRDGTTSGTLRLATRTGGSGVEETIVDNLSSTGSTAGAQFTGAGGVRTTGLINTNSSQYGNNIVFSAPASTTYYLLATLPTSNGGTYDHLRIDAMYGTWTGGAISTSTFTFSNREGFVWRHYLSGHGTLGNVKLRAYSLANGSVEIWVSGEASQFMKFAYNISSAQQVVTVANPVPTTTVPTGTVVFDSSNVATYPPVENQHGGLSLLSTSNNQIPLRVYGTSGQTDDLVQFYRGLTYSGAIERGGAFNIQPSQTNNGYGMFVRAGTATGIVIRSGGGALQQWQSSAGAVLGGINPNAQIFTGSTAPIQTAVGAGINGVSGNGTTVTFSTTNAHNLVDGDTVTIAGLTPAGYNGTYTVSGVSTFSFNVANTTTGTASGSGTVNIDSQVSVTPRSRATSGLVVGSVASQVSNPFEVRNSSGVVIANVSAGGSVRGTGTLQGASLSAVSDGSTVATLSSSGNIQFRGAASYGGGVGVIGIANATTAPSTNPAGGGVLFVNAGALQYRGTGGGNATLVNADGTTPYLGLGSSYFAGHNTEGRIMYNAYLTNDMANARLRGSAVAATQNGVAYTISNADWDAMFDGTASFLNISPTSGFTFPLVITVPLPRTLTYGASVGISFGSTGFRANSVQIEVFSLDSSSWVSVFNTTTNTSEDIFTAISGIANNNATGINQVRYTISSPNSTQLRIAHLWAYNFNSDMWSQTMMPRAGGAFYGAIRNNNTLNGFGVSGTPAAWGGMTPTVEIRGSNSSTSGINFFMNGGPFIRAYDGSGNARGAWGTDGSIVVGPSNTKLGTLSVHADAAGTIGSVVRGFGTAGTYTQTANLEEWQSWNGTTASTLSKIDSAGKIFIPGGTTIYDYAVESGGSTDTAWKKLIEVTCPTGLYTGASYEIEVIDNFDNYGIIDRVPLRFKFYVKVTRTGGVQDDVLAASVTGPSVNYVRVVKTSNSLYEIQVRQPDVFRVVSFKARRIVHNNTSESYNPSGRSYGSLAAGSTTGTIYVPVNDSTTSANFLVDNFSQVSANRMTIQPLGTLAATIPLLTLTGTSTQNSSYVEFRNSGGTPITSITSTGNITTSAGISLTGSNSPINLPTGGNGTSGQVLSSAGSGSTPTWTTAPTLSGNNTFTGTQTWDNTVYLGSGLNASVGLEIGYRGGTATTPFIDFHSGATDVDFDSRIIASGGTGTSGQGTLTYTAATSAFTGAITANGRLTLKPVANAANQSNGILISNTSDAWQSGLYLKTDGSGNPRLTLLAPTGGMGEAIAIDSAAKVGIGIVDPPAQLTVVSALSTRIASIVRGASGQSVNIQEWQANGPTTLASVSQTGKGTFDVLSAPNGAFFGNITSQPGSPSAYLAVQGYSPQHRPLLVRGFGATTANLVDYQNGSGVVVGGSNGVGQIFTGSASPLAFGVGGATTATSGDGTTATITTTSAHGLAVGDIVTVAGITPTGYNGGFSVASTPTTTSFTYANTTTGSQTVAGTVSIAPQLGVVSRSAGTIGAVVRGATSQSSDLLVAQNSAASTLFSVASTGAIYTGSTLFTTAQTYIYGAADYGAALNVQTKATGSQGIIVRGRVSQTANLTEWQSWDGTTATTVARVLPNGDILGNSVRTINQNGTLTEESSGARLTLVKLTTAATNPGANTAKLYFRDGTTAGTLKFVARTGASGIEETIIDNLSSTGSTAGAQFVGAGGVLTTGTVSLGSGTYDNYNADSSLRLEFRGTAGTQRPYIELQGVSSNDGANENGGAFIRFRTSRSAGYGAEIGAVRRPLGAAHLIFKTGTGTVDSITQKMLIDENGNVLVNGFASGTVGLTVRGATGQSVNLQEWQAAGSPPTVLASVNSAGDIITTSAMLAGTTTWLGASLNVRPINQGIIGQVIRGTGTQQVDMLQIQTSLGVNLSGINANGQIWTGSTLPLTTSTGGATTATSGTGTVATVTTTNNHNLSTGDRVTVAGITPTGYNGTFIVTGTPTTTTFTYANTTTGSQTVAGTVRVDSQTSITSRSAATVGLVVRGATSQVTDIQQWQISDGTVRSYITADGSFLTSSTLTTMGNLRVAGTAGTGGGSGVIGIANAGTAPTSNPTGGGVLFVESGAIRYRGTSNAARTIINADGTDPNPVDGTTSTAAAGVGYMGLPQNATTTGSYTVVAADAGKHIYASATRTVTINSNTNLALPIGTTLTFIAGSGATMTIAITSDTMYLAGPGTTGSRTLAPFGMATAVKITSTSWMISGNGLT